MRGQAHNRSHRSKAGFIYVISAANGYVKIGQCAKDPVDRFTSLASGSPVPLALSYACRCDRPVELEISLHDALKGCWRHREWFEIRAEKAIQIVRRALQERGCRIIPGEPKLLQSNGKPYATLVLINEIAV